MDQGYFENVLITPNLLYVLSKCNNELGVFLRSFSCVLKFLENRNYAVILDFFEFHVTNF